jgi:ankyrin repeat protein
MAFLHGKIEILQNGNQGIQLDFFFTARGTEMQRTPLGMLRSLLNQIFDLDATVRPQVRKIYGQRCRQFGYGEGKWEWPQVVLEELLADVILASASRQHVTVFVDALDETGAESAQQLAAYFHRLMERAAKEKAAIRICISCRHYPIIGSAQATELHVEEHNHKDIATYINDILTETEVDYTPSKDMIQMLMEQAIHQANNVFQWARLVMPFARQRILEGESFDEICCWLSDVPAGLEDVYMYILNHVIEVRNLKQSFSLFQWVCLAERPLTVIELRYALAGNNAQITRAPKIWEKISGFIESNERMKRRIKALSGGLAEVVSSGASNEYVQVIHQSVNDFLRAKGLAALSDNIGANRPVLEKEQILSYCQANIYRSCLVYLALLRIRGDRLNDYQVTREDLIRNHPLLAYAITNLFIHAEKAAQSRLLILLNEQNTLQQVFSQWVQIYQIVNPYDPACPPENTTIIHMAAASNLVDIIERVSSKSEKVASKDGVGNTPFHLAARHGHIAVGKALLEKAADCETTNKSGKTPLIEAASYGHTEFVEWLLLEGVKLETTTDGAESALQAASNRGHQTIVEILLGAGANVNAQGGKYGNALQNAVYRKNSEIVQMLLDAGADVNAQGGRYGNALQAAAYGDSIEVGLEFLDPSTEFDDQPGSYRESCEIVQMLLDAGADVNAQGGEYGNALQTAVYRKNSKIVQMLLDAGAIANPRIP